MDTDYLRKQKLKEKREAERRAPKGIAKLIAWIGGIIGLVLLFAYESAESSCRYEARFFDDEGTLCAPLRMIANILNWFSS